MEDSGKEVNETALQQDLAEPEPAIVPAITQPTTHDLFFAVVLSLLFQILVGFIAGASVAASGRNWKAVAPEFYAYLTPVSLAFTLIVTCYFAWRKYGGTFADAFMLTPLRTSQLVAYICVAFGLSIVALAILSVAYAWVPKSLSGDSKVARVMQSPGAAPVWMVSALFAPIVEELFFRGFAFPVLQRRYSTRAAVLIVALWFAGAHVPQLIGDWAGLVAIVMVSVVLTSLRARTGSLTPSLVVHFVYNAALIGLSFASRGAGG